MPFILNEQVKFEGLPPSQVIGLDHYNLQNFENITLEWVSYTLVSSETDGFSRWWITEQPGQGPWVWFAAPSGEIPPHCKILPQFSGLASISFVGDVGVSTPVAALSVFEVNPDLRFAYERFLNSSVLCFFSRPLNSFSA